tara:strand:- start:77 stop:1756 length:1680 start_codon:yes stop_codon:yes gene_type:complete
VSVWRLYLVVAGVLLASAGLAGRVLYLHLVDRDFLQDQGDARTIRMERVNAHRGIISDRHGTPLAISSPVVSLWANPSEIDDPGAVATQLAAGLGLSAELVTRRLVDNRDRAFVYIRRRVPPATAGNILALGLPGIYGEKEYQRYYPAGEVTAHVVGFTNVDDQGQEGVELAFDDFLAGTSGKKKVLKNLYGAIVKDIKPVVEAKPGRDLSLSIDMRLQFLAYRELKSAIAQFGAESGTFIILDVLTGEVMAMVNQPSFNPNMRANLNLAAVRNRAVTDVFEPGSTVKPLTVAVALASGDFTPASRIDTSPGRFRVGKKTIRDPGNRGVMSLADIVAHSSQVGISKLALELPEYDVWATFQAMGFGQPTGAGFPGERGGFLPNHRRWQDIERVTFAYGYGLTVTPLQLASAYQTIAAGGVRRELSILHGRAPRGSRVMDRQIALDLTAILNHTVRVGTASRADVEAYSVAGKTGTVRKLGVEGDYKDTSHLTFFAGIAPASRPRLVGVVMINDPDVPEAGGGTIAAPVFSRVIGGALRLLNVPPDEAALEVAALDGAAS